MTRGLLALLLCAAPAAAQDVSSALARAEEAYQRVRTLRAAFTQTLIHPMLGDPEASRGLLFLEPPDRFAMRFVEPAQDRIVADGTWLWVYAPSSVPDQVIRQPVPTGGASTPNLMAQFVERPLERYRAGYVQEDTVHDVVVDVVRLVPRTENAGFSAAEIAVARDDGVLRRIVLSEAGGQRRVLVFDDIRVNGTVAPAEFRFEVPPGTRVVTP